MLRRTATLISRHVGTRTRLVVELSFPPIGWVGKIDDGPGKYRCAWLGPLLVVLRPSYVKTPHGDTNG